jgi:hypothetical protein
MCSFSRIYWVDGTSRETMEASIISIAADEDAKSAGIEASSPSILQWLGRREDNWLMIFDGADMGYEIVEGFIPPGKHGNILISSRNTIMNRLSLPSNAYMEVVELDEDAAMDLFVKSARLGSLSSTEQGHAKMIVRELCCLALAVDQAACSIATGICRVDEYLALYKRRRHELMNDTLFKGSSNYGHAVYTTWDISFAELECRAFDSSPDSVQYETAILILRLFSFFHFDGIREEIFRRVAETTTQYLDPLLSGSKVFSLLQQTEENEWDAFNFRAGIRILSQFCLVKPDGKSIQTYSMHRLVHQWMQDRLPKPLRSEMALLAATVLAQSDYGARAEDHAHRRALLVHLTTLSTHLKQAGVMNQLSVCTTERLAYIYRQGGKPADAEALLRQAISLLQKDTSKATKQYIRLLSHLAYALGELGRLREAEALRGQVLEWREKHLGINHVSTAVARNNLANILCNRWELGRAKELGMQVLDHHKKSLGMNDLRTYQVMADLAVTLRRLGKLREAMELQIQVLDWRKKHLGMNHPGTYRAMANLAITLRDLGELERAKELEIQVLNWRKEHLGMNHPGTYMAMANSAVTLYGLGEHGKVKELQIQVLDWRREHLGVDHRDTYQAMCNLVTTIYKLGVVSEAKSLEVEVLDWCKAHLGLRHPHTIFWINHLAYVFKGSPGGLLSIGVGFFHKPFPATMY